MKRSADAEDLRLLVERAGGAPCTAPAVPLLAVLPLVRLTLPLFAPLSACNCKTGSRKDSKRKEYTLWRQFDEKPSIIPGCPGKHRFYIAARHQLLVMQLGSLSLCVCKDQADKVSIACLLRSTSSAGVVVFSTKSVTLGMKNKSTLFCSWCKRLL